MSRLKTPAINHFIVSGKLAENPTVREYNKKYYIAFRLSVDNGWYDKDGNKTEKYDIIDAEYCSGKAHNLSDILAKDDPVVLEGTLTSRGREYKDNMYYDLKLRVNKVHILEHKEYGKATAKEDEDLF